jgi:hypothetical protein
MVMAPASTGRDSSNNIAVTKIAHPNNGNLCNFCPGALMFITVVMTYLKINLKRKANLKFIFMDYIFSNIYKFGV